MFNFTDLLLEYCGLRNGDLFKNDTKEEDKEKELDNFVNILINKYKLKYAPEQLKQFIKTRKTKTNIYFDFNQKKEELSNKRNSLIKSLDKYKEYIKLFGSNDKLFDKLKDIKDPKEFKRVFDKIKTNNSIMTKITDSSFKDIINKITEIAYLNNVIEKITELSLPLEEKKLKFNNISYRVNQSKIKQKRKRKQKPKIKQIPVQQTTQQKPIQQKPIQQQTYQEPIEQQIQQPIQQKPIEQQIQQPIQINQEQIEQPVQKSKQEEPQKQEQAKQQEQQKQQQEEQKEEKSEEKKEELQDKIDVKVEDKVKKGNKNEEKDSKEDSEEISEDYNEFDDTTDLGLGDDEFFGFDVENKDSKKEEVEHHAKNNEYFRNKINQKNNDTTPTLPNI